MASDMAKVGAQPLGAVHLDRGQHVPVNAYGLWLAPALSASSELRGALPKCRVPFPAHVCA